LGSAGYGQYEISNWAKDGRECSHNLQYWRGEPYFGFGAGAHGYVSGCRYSNVLAIKGYIERFVHKAADHRGAAPGPKAASFETAPTSSKHPCSPAAINQHRQGADDDMAEFMIMGLRLTTEGVSAGRFDRRYGRRLSETYGRQIDDLTHLGLLERVESKASDAHKHASETIRLTKRGRLLGNQVFIRFLRPDSATLSRRVT
ncbi:MAG: hypothetical protein V1755_11315, partial [Chloroflexota bacterium]